MVTTQHTFSSVFERELVEANELGYDVRKQAQDSLASLAMPTTKWEEWKYTSVKDIIGQEYALETAPSIHSIEPYLIPNLEADVLVFVNGVYSENLSRLQYNDQENLIVKPISALNSNEAVRFEEHFGFLAQDQDIFTALNTAFGSQGTFVHIPAGKSTSHPIHLLYLNNSTEQANAAQTRNLFVVGRSGEGHIIETSHHEGTHKSFHNALTEIRVEANAGLSIYKIQHESETAAKLDAVHVHQAQDSRFNIYTLSFEGGWIRNDLEIHLEGENAYTMLRGLCLLHDEQHVDNRTLIHHKAAHCDSNELYKNIIDDKATAVFNGKIHVWKDAQKTNSFQENRNILLSDTATINAKPQLEIYADDVKCSHGATTGQLDTQALFYLQARGIPFKQARALLMNAFAMEVIENISIPALLEYVEGLVAKRFA